MSDEAESSRRRTVRSRRSQQDVWLDGDRLDVDMDMDVQNNMFALQELEQLDELDSLGGSDPEFELSDEDSGSEDEYRPDRQRRSDGDRRSRKQGPSQRGLTHDESEEEEFRNSSSEGESSEWNDSEGSSRLSQPIVRRVANRGQTNEQRGARPQKGRQHAGLENIDSWRLVGEQRRHDVAGGQGAEEIEFRQDEIEDLASAFSGVNANVSIENVQQWNSALHADHDPDEELDEEGFEDDLRIASGFRRKSTRDRQGRTRKAPRVQTLSPEVQRLLSEANVAFINDELEKAIDKLTEVIRIEPAVRSAWATMALCFGELGKKERRLQCRIMEAHLTSHPIGLWVELAQESESLGFFEQSLYCLSKAIGASRDKDKSDVLDVMWQRGQFLLDRGEKKEAAKQFLSMLRYRPQNQHITREVLPILFELHMLDKAVQILQKSAEWNMKTFPDPTADSACDDEGVAYTYETSEILTLADLLLDLNRPREAIDAIRKGQRWLQGRASEVFWDELQADDREFDPDWLREERRGDYGRQINLAETHELDLLFRHRLGLARARLGDIHEAETHFDIWLDQDFDDLDWEYYANPSGEVADEYIRFASELEDEENEEANRLFTKALQIALELHEKRNPRSDEDEEDNGGRFDEDISEYKRIAACYMGLGQHADAVEYLDAVVQDDPEDLESKLKLAEAYGALENHERAVAYIREVMLAKTAMRQLQAQSTDEQQSSQTAADDAMTQSLSLFTEISQRNKSHPGRARGKSSHEEALRLEAVNEAEAVSMFEQAKGLEKDVFVERWWHHDCPMTGDTNVRVYGVHESPDDRKRRFAAVSDWLNSMERLVNMFTDTPQLYPRDKSKKFAGLFRRYRKRGDRLDRQARALLARIGRVMIDEDFVARSIEKSTFRGITLNDWTSLLMQYAFVLTKVGEFSDARSVVVRAMKSNVVWSDLERSQSLSLCLTACALYAGQWDVALSELALRSLPNRSQFRNEPLRILSVVAHGGGYSSHRALTAPNNLKFFLRRNRIIEAIAQGTTSSFNFSARRWVSRVKLFEKMGDESGDEEGEEQGDDDDDDDNNIEARERTERGSLSGVSRSRASDVSMTTTTHVRVPKSTKDGDPASVWKEMSGYMSMDMVRGLSASQHKPPTKYNPASDAFYAGLLLTSSSGIPSMGYWLRAFARFKNDPLICLGCAIACLGRATNRQVDNRHQVIAEAFTFLHLYRTLRRKEWPLTRTDNGEVEYNMGRATHHLGLFQMALRHYNAVLRRSTKHMIAKEEFFTSSMMDLDSSSVNGAALDNSIDRSASLDCSAEAAFALHQLYITAGNPTLANSILERHLRV